MIHGLYICKAGLGLGLGLGQSVLVLVLVSDGLGLGLGLPGLGLGLLVLVLVLVSDCLVLTTTLLTTQPRRVIEQMASDDFPIAAYDRLRRRAAQIGQKFSDVFLKFADVHQAINHSNPLSELDIERAGKHLPFIVHVHVYAQSAKLVF